MKIKLIRRGILLTVLLAFFFSFICESHGAATGSSKWVQNQDGSIYACLTTGQTTPASVNSVSYKYAFQTPAIQRTESGCDQVSIVGLETWDGVPGAPTVPFKTVRLLLAYGQQIDGIKIIPGQKSDLTGTYTIEQIQAAYPLSQTPPSEPTQPDPAIYGSDNPYPEIPADAFMQSKDGYPIVVVTLYPVLYRPLSGKVSYYSNITIELQTTALPQTQSNGELTPKKERADEIRGFVDNPTTIDAYVTGLGSTDSVSNSIQ